MTDMQSILDQQVLPALAGELGMKSGDLVQRYRELANGNGHRTIKLTALDSEILGTMASNGDASVSTAELTAELRERREALDLDPAKRERVYSRCRRLEEKLGLLGSEKVKSKRRLYFSPATGDVLNHANYKEIDGVVAHLKGIVAKYPIKRGAQIPPNVKNGLRRDFTAYLDRLAASADQRHSGQIRSFKGQVMKVLQGTTKSDVTGSIGLVGFNPEERRWKLILVIKKLILALMLANDGVLPGDVPWALIELLKELLGEKEA